MKTNRTITVILAIALCVLAAGCSKGLPVKKVGEHKYVSLTSGNVLLDDASGYLPVAFYDWYNKLFIALAKIIESNRDQKAVDAFNKMVGEFNEFLSFDAKRIDEEMQQDMTDEAYKNATRVAKNVSSNYEWILDFINNDNYGEYGDYELLLKEVGSRQTGFGSYIVVILSVVNSIEGAFPKAKFDLFHKLDYLVEP
jgi:hypothetical protein